MINGESYKRIVAEAAKLAIGDENILERVFIVEVLSVIIQTTYFKYTRKKFGEGKRVFKMAPIHHHFELKGWHESKVVVRFWIIGILLALLSLTTFKTQ